MVIAGAGGFAREMLEILLQQDYNGEVFFFDDVDPLNKKVYDTYTVLKNPEELQQVFARNKKFCLGIGGPLARQKLYNKLTALGGICETIISPHAYLGKNKIEIGQGSSVSTGTVITTNIAIGKGCLINLNCTIGHGTVIGDFCELSPGVHISGNCTINNFCSIGTGAVLLPHITIGNNVTIGAGAVITKNIEDGQVIVGIPGKPINHT